MVTAGLFEGRFGLERETLRVDGSGALAATPHPFTDEHLDRDFCENQLEIITPVCGTIEQLISSITELHNYAVSELKKNGEYLWLYSNPPHIESEEDIPIARFTGSMAFKHDYRVKLWRRYGKKLMLLSGIHFNLSFGSAAFSGQDSDTAYFRLAKQVMRYGWLIVLLTAASPVYDLSFDENGAEGSAFNGAASIRISEKGYWNQFVPALDYTDIKSYAASIDSYVEKGALFSPGELYLPVRLKPRGSNNPRSLVTDGVDHIELRMFDLNPLSPLGVLKEDLEFAHYFLLYLLTLPDFDFTPDMQRTAVSNFKNAAKYDLDQIEINGCGAADAALGLLCDMEFYFSGNDRVSEIIGLQKRKLTDNKRYCVKIYDVLKNDYQNTMFKASKEGGI